jgi:streptogramin lyase
VRPTSIRRLAAAALAVCLVLLLPTGAAAGEPVGMIEQFSSPGWITSLAPGAGRGVWFTFENDTVAGDHFARGLGHAGAAGKARQVDVGLGRGAVPLAVSGGPGDDVWLRVGGKHPALARIAPSGSIRKFRLPAVPSLPAFAVGSVWFTAGGRLWRLDGNGPPRVFAVPGTVTAVASYGEGPLWFAGGLNGAATVGRVDALGAVAEYGAGLPAGTGVANLTADAEGGAWFLVGGPSTPKGPQLGRVGPAGEISIAAGSSFSPTYFAGPIAGAAGELWFTTGGEAGTPDGTPSSWPAASVGRIGADGSLTPLTECLRPLQPYAGPKALTLGAEGNAWFAIDSETEYHGGIGGPSGIGRVTPSGQITEFEAGLGIAPTAITTAGDGAIWVGSDEERGLARLLPPSAPPNAFRFLGGSSVGAGGTGTARLLAPGPGEARIEALNGSGAPEVQTEAIAVTCRPASLVVRPSVPVLRKAARKGRLEVHYRLTYVPTGGTPYSQRGATYVDSGR